MSELKPKHPLIRLRLQYQGWYDAVSMIVYVLLVYLWGLGVYPMGRDYPLMESMGEALPAVSRMVLRWEIYAFGAHPVPYHAVNLLLLYACMLCMYKLTNLVVRGLFWFGTLAACLFMANPVHSEAVLNLTGSVDLLPCLFALFATMCYVWHVRSPRTWSLPVSLALVLVASVAFPQNAAIPLVLVLFEVLIPKAGERKASRTALCLLIGIVAMILAYRAADSAVPWYQRFVPLYFFVYPIGFLPETVRAFIVRPWTAYIAAAVVFAIFVLVYRNVRRPALLFGFLAMLVVRFAPVERPVDLVHMVGGGQLLLPHAFLAIAAVSLAFRIMENVKWRTPMVGITTTLVIFVFLTQFASVRRWQEAGGMVRDFQARALDVSDEHPDSPFAVAPDFQYFHGAPMCLSTSVSHQTPFSEPLAAESYLPIHAMRAKYMQVTGAVWMADGGRFTVEGVGLSQLMPNYGLLISEGQSVGVKDAGVGRGVVPGLARIVIEQAEDERVVIRVVPDGKPLPEHVVGGVLE